MKKINHNSSRRGFFLGRLTAALAAGLTCIASVCMAGPFDSPVGTWDCVLGGYQQGVAYLTFNGDGSFIGYEVLVPRHPKSGNSSVTGRGSTGNRLDDGDSNTNSVTTTTNIFGSEPIWGEWGYNEKGQVIGHFYEYAGLICDTNGCVSMTNAISFVGKVNAGKRMNLMTSSVNGRGTYRCIPASTLSDISGSYYGELKAKGGVDTIEFLSLAPSVDPDASQFPNAYDVVGTGPGYVLGGIVLLSSQNKVGFAAAIGSEQIRAVVGAANSRKFKSNMKGWQQPSGSLTNWVRFSLTQEPTP